jgi:hypothetical protein
LNLGQVIQKDDGNLRETDEFGRLVASMAGNDLPVPIYQDRRVETERLDTFGDSPDLRPTVFAGVV